MIDCYILYQGMVDIRPPITLEDLEMAGSTPDPVKLDACNCDHCVSQAKLEQVVRYYLYMLLPYKLFWMNKGHSEKNLCPDPSVYKASSS